MSKIKILGEDRFMFHTEADLVWITHSKWSLIGVGERLSSAKLDLIRRALIIQPFYVNCDDSELSEEAIKLKEWLIPIRVYK